jgi:hypothetical protein
LFHVRLLSRQYELEVVNEWPDRSISHRKAHDDAIVEHGLCCGVPRVAHLSFPANDHPVERKLTVYTPFPPPMASVHQRQATSMVATANSNSRKQELASTSISKVASAGVWKV